MAEVPRLGAASDYGFLFTDIEGSTQLISRIGVAYASLLEDHRGIIRGAIEHWGGLELGTEGDGFSIVFEDASSAIGAALEAQSALLAHPWPTGSEVRVRMGVHLGPAWRSGDKYTGLGLHHAARVAACGHGGQIIASQQVVDRVDDKDFLFLGRFRLKDVPGSTPLYQLLDRRFPASFSPLRAQPVEVQNLPSFGPFISRPRLVQRILSEIEAGRLVTLTGPGGAGKTRTAMEVARRTVMSFGDGAFFVDLAGTFEPRTIVPTILQALQATAPGDADVDHLVQVVGSRSMLVILDNCEHVAETCAEVIEAVGRCCPALKVLATSREPLFVEAERVVTVGQLEPDEAVELFLQRAAAAGTPWEPKETERAMIDDLCTRLDRLPLAVELAAAQVPMLDIGSIIERLDERFSILVGANRSRHHRQRTLEATIQWSWDLLDPHEREVLARLSVFAGPVPLELIELLLGDTSAIRHLTNLVSKSLVVVDHDQRRRYRLLESVRVFARHRLEEGEAMATWRARHLDAVIHYLRRRADSLQGPNPATAVDDLRSVRDEIRLAHDWADGTPHVADLLAAAGLISLRVIDVVPEYEAWVARALSVVDIHPTTRLMLMRTMVVYGDYDAEAARQGLDLALRLRDREAEVDFRSEAAGQAANSGRDIEKNLRELQSLGHLADHCTDVGVRRRYSYSLAGALRLNGDSGAALAQHLRTIARFPDGLGFDEPFILAHAARCLDTLGRPEEARNMLERALDAALRNRDGDAETWARVTLGEVILNAGDPLAADPHLAAAYEVSRRLGTASEQPYSASIFARCRVALGDTDGARSILANCEQPTGSSSFLETVWLWACADLDAAEGRVMEAVSCWRSLLAKYHELSFHNMTRALAASLADFQDHLDQELIRSALDHWFTESGLRAEAVDHLLVDVHSVQSAEPD